MLGRQKLPFCVIEIEIVTLLHGARDIGRALLDEI
jgi:hypothetical protein